MTKKPESAGQPAASTQSLLRSIPKVDEFLGWLDPPPDAPFSLVKSSVRQLLDALRQEILKGAPIEPAALTRGSLLPRFSALLAARLRPNFRTVINATGVVIHTNLGRSLLPEAAIESLLAVAGHYSNLEFDLATGKRGSRYSLVEDLLCELTGAEAALVVNNNAAAVMLVLDTLAKGKEVIVSDFIPPHVFDQMREKAYRYKPDGYTIEEYDRHVTMAVEKAKQIYRKALRFVAQFR